VFWDICECTGWPTVDRFATNANKLVARYNSYFWEIETNGVDAFAQQNWLCELNYCNPPFSMLGRFTNFVIYDVPRAVCIVVVPKWTGSPWYSQLYNHATKVYELPAIPHLFVRILPQHESRSYVTNSSWRFVVMLLNMNVELPANFRCLK
jgi:hypothetical protein